MDAKTRVMELAHAEGFDLVRVAPADMLGGPRRAAHERLEAGDLADMSWMSEEWIDRATDPQAFLEGARSVVLVALNCHAPDPAIADDTVSRGRVARYARGRDYHRVFEKKLRGMAREIRAEFDAGARATVDYGPLLERPLAAQAGLGWIGKSTMLLSPGAGPWTLLGAIATTLDLEPDPPLAKSCGSCVRCIDACPTGAIVADGYSVDARLCISYHTIENRGDIPVELRPAFGDRVFGCDDCLDECPVGAKNNASYPDFAPVNADDAFPPLVDLLELDDEAFTGRFRGRAIMRAKRDGMARNAAVALGNTGRAGDIPALARAMHADRSPSVRGHAAWAVGQLVARHGEAENFCKELLLALDTETDEGVRAEISAAIAHIDAA